VSADEVAQTSDIKKDVTTNTSDGHFLYLQSLSSTSHQIAVMEGEMLENTCYISLWYRVHGDNSTRLKMIIRTPGSDHPKTVLTDWTGTLTTQWEKRRIPVTSNVESRVQFTGKLGRAHNSYIAIDNIQYEKCQVRQSHSSASSLER
jgi:hypothetical protein